MTVDNQPHLVKVHREDYDQVNAKLNLSLQVDDDEPTEFASTYHPGDVLIHVDESHESNILQFVEKNAYTYSLIHRGTQFDLQVMTPHQKKLNEFI